MLLFISGEAAFLCDLQSQTGLPWLMAVLGYLCQRGSAHSDYLVIGLWIACRGISSAVLRRVVLPVHKSPAASSLPILEIHFDPSSPYKELKWNLPFVFQIFCSRCSSHSAPLPRYGQMKPVRVCTHCYVFHVTPFYSDKAGIWRIKPLVCHGVLHGLIYLT